jgi:2-oxoglutarate ferredoxin oxidoreductase subunit gamma
MVNRKPTRTDIQVVILPANEIAREIGNERATNMVMLGALLANMDILPIEALEKALKNHTAQRLQKFVEMNIQALRRGAEYRANL